MSDRRLVIETENPRAIFGFYGPYATDVVALTYFKNISTLDPSARLVSWTDAQREARMRDVMEKREADAAFRHSTPPTT